jgi:ERCC4-related helicase
MEKAAGAGAIEDLLPRRYQEEIFTRAQRANIIAALGTGSGKTFISTLLIRWIASRGSLREKAIVFLVPKVTLVEQQGDFIAKQTPLRVLKLHGSLHMHMADQVGWKKRFEQYDVFVMTGIVQRLRFAHLSIPCSTDLPRSADPLALGNQQGTFCRTFAT